MAEDVMTYFLQKEAEFRDTCAAPPDATFLEEEGSDGTRGKVEARIHMTEDAYLDVLEKVVVKPEGGVRREAYCYALIIEGAHSDSWERDPVHPDNPVHGHTGPDRERQPAEVISFKEAVERAWDIVTDREQAPWDD